MHENRNEFYNGKLPTILIFFELDDDTLNGTKMNETQVVSSSNQEQGMNHGLTFFVTGMIILILGILTLIAISRIFWFEWSSNIRWRTAKNGVFNFMTKKMILFFDQGGKAVHACYTF